MISTQLQKLRVVKEQELLLHMEDILNAKAIYTLLGMSGQLDTPGEDLQAHSYPVSRRFGGELYKICNNAMAGLGLEKLNVRFFICNSSESNAEAYYSFEENEPHSIVIYSGLLEHFNPSELSFVVGHELGHLIFGHAVIKHVLYNIYPTPDVCPALLRITFDLWRKLAEISADRVGLLVVRDIKPALQAMFKLSAGVDMSYFNIESDDYIAFIEELVSKLAPASGSEFDTHPLDPMRVKALQVFGSSKTFATFNPGKTITQDKELQDKMESLMPILEKEPRSVLEFAVYSFLLQAGAQIIKADHIVTSEELSSLADILSDYCQYPQPFIEKALKKSRLGRDFAKSAAFIVRNIPHRTRCLFDNLIILALRDNIIDDGEFKSLLEIGTKYLKIPPQEVAEMILRRVTPLYTSAPSAEFAAKKQFPFSHF
jgi:hypothetical protein